MCSLRYLARTLEALGALLEIELEEVGQPDLAGVGDRRAEVDRFGVGAVDGLAVDGAVQGLGRGGAQPQGRRCSFGGWGWSWGLAGSGWRGWRRQVLAPVTRLRQAQPRGGVGSTSTSSVRTVGGVNANDGGGSIANGGGGSIAIGGGGSIANGGAASSQRWRWVKCETERAVSYEVGAGPSASGGAGSSANRGDGSVRSSPSPSGGGPGRGPAGGASQTRPRCSATRRSKTTPSSPLVERQHHLRRQRVRLAGQHEAVRDPRSCRARNCVPSGPRPRSAWRGRCRRAGSAGRTAPPARRRRRRRGCWAGPCGTRSRAAAPSRTIVMRACSASPGFDSWITAPTCCACGASPKRLDVDALFRHPRRQQRGLGLVVHLERPADEGMVDARRRHHAGEELADLCAVHHAHVERRVGVLVREDVVQHQPASGICS